MVRKSRCKSNSGIYHAMARGNDRQLIFRDPADYRKYLRILGECKTISGFKLYAYCLMPNHIHLLIQEGSEDLGKSFQRIGSRYATWFNKKYQRCGYLFQDRFKSSPVDDNRYFLALLRYIHRNPTSAGLCCNVADYKWSSFREFAGTEHLIDKDYPMQLFSNDKTMALIAFMTHVCHEEDPLLPEPVPFFMRKVEHTNTYLSSDFCTRINESERALRLLTAQGQADRAKYIQKLKSEGVPLKQIAKHLNVSLWTVRNA